MHKLQFHPIHNGPKVSYVDECGDLTFGIVKGKWGDRYWRIRADNGGLQDLTFDQIVGLIPNK